MNIRVRVSFKDNIRIEYVGKIKYHSHFSLSILLQNFQPFAPYSLYFVFERFVTLPSMRQNVSKHEEILHKHAVANFIFLNYFNNCFGNP